MATPKSTLARGSNRIVSTAEPVRVERKAIGRNDCWYVVTGSRADFIGLGLASSDWFPQGRKRVTHGGNWGMVDGVCRMHWEIKKHAGDFELRIWNATEAQRKLLDPLVPIDPEEVARKQQAAVECWGSMIEATWRTASRGKDFRLSERDQSRFLEALRAALAILNSATIVNVEQQQSALGVARQDQTFQQFMLEQGLRGASA